MKWVTRIIIYTCLCCYTSIATAQYIIIDDTKNAQELIEDVLVNSSCAIIMDPKATGDNFSGTQKSYAYFNAGTSTFPFKEGVVLSTWSSTNSKGPYISNKGGGDSRWKGDSDLVQALGITNTVNATVLEFDFTPLTNFISFKYIFASNEYQYYFPCEFSDGFAFLIKEKGSSAVYENLAVLPGTAIPVSSTSVHPFIPPFNDNEPGCPAENESYFGGNNGSTSPINYSAQTVVLNAQSTVIAGKTYHVKLVIADDGNEEYDSAVFLEAGSFLPKIDLGPDRLLATNTAICFGESYIIDPKLPLNHTYKWYKNNEPLPEITPTYTTTIPGLYRVEVEITNNCIATEEIKVEYIPEIILNNTTLSQCDEDANGFTFFDLTKVDNIVKNNSLDLSAVVYYQSMADAKAQNNAITTTSNFQNTTANQSVFARVTNMAGCENYAEVQLNISNTIITAQDPIITCDVDDAQDGLAAFELNTQVSPIVLAGLPAGLAVDYYLNDTDAYTEQNKLPAVFRNTITNQQTIFARIVNGPDCVSITPIILKVNSFDPPDFQEESFILCEGFTMDLAVDPGFSSYLWNNGATTNRITIDSPGTYFVTVLDENGCQKTKRFIVSLSGIATITGVKVTDLAGNKNSITIEYTGNGAYEFSIDGDLFQDNATFLGIAAGEYLVYARDKNGCGLSLPVITYVLDYPRYFTPNNDGFNDVWNIKNLESLPKSTLYIFDRYGKLLKQLSTSSNGWNGTFNGLALPADDYWFHLNLENGRTIKGHFSLKR